MLKIKLNCNVLSVLKESSKLLSHAESEIQEKGKRNYHLP